VPTDDELRRFLRAFAVERPRWGWRRALVAAREAGFRVNHKKVHRLWRDEGLKVPYRKRKRPLGGIGVKVGAFCPIAPDVVWAMDFQFESGRARACWLRHVVNYANFPIDKPSGVTHGGKKRQDTDEFGGGD
jgi:transposase InsO family protein